MSQLSEYMADALKGSRDIMNGAMDGVSAEQAAKAPGGSANSIASLYVHAVFDEDALISMAAGKESLWASGWKEKVGGSDSMGLTLDDATKAYAFDPDKFSQYAQAVADSSDATIRAFSDADLERKVDMGDFGAPSVAEIVRDFVTWHYAFHSGEVSSQKGVMGLQGIPF